MRILALVLIVLGIVGLVHRGFTVTTEEEKASIGPLSVRVEKKERVAVPVWASIAAIGVGAALLLAAGRGKAS